MNRNQLLTVACLTVLAGCGEGQSPETARAQQNAAGAPMPAPAPARGNAPGNPDMSDLAEVDTDGDGRMSRSEWQAKDLPESSFKGLERGRGYVTLQDYRENAAPPGIDLNGDGKVTIAEFREFDRRMAEKIKKGGPR